MLAVMWPLEHWFHLPIYINLPIGQLIGAIIVWPFDKYIFSNRTLLQGELWQIKDISKCIDCGRTRKGYRLVSKDNGYDKSHDQHPEFRCWRCAKAKYRREQG
jgi:hypothetical protein